VKRQVVDEGMC